MNTARSQDDWVIGDPAANALWDEIMGDGRLDRARSKLSLHELRLMIGHAQRHFSRPATPEIFEALERAFLFICHNCPLGPTNARTDAGKLIDSLRVPLAAARDLLDEQVSA